MHTQNEDLRCNTVTKKLYIQSEDFRMCHLIEDKQVCKVCAQSEDTMTKEYENVDTHVWMHTQCEDLLCNTFSKKLYI